MKKIKKTIDIFDNVALISFLLFIFLFVYFFYIALTSSPNDINELDSLGQHIPLAKSILEGGLFDPPQLHNGLGYYLPIGEIILSVFMWFGIPLGSYNLVALVLLFFLCYKLAMRVGMHVNLAIVFSFSITYVNSILRLVPTQKNDVWLDVFFVWVLYLILRPKMSIKYFLTLGVAVGLLVGVKYSGIILALIVLGGNFNNIKYFITNTNIIVFLFPVTILGIIWYARNYVLTGNPFYPISLFSFVGHPEFMVPQGYENFLHSNSMALTIEALISEYLIWSFIPLYLLYLAIFKGVSMFKEVKPLLIIGGLSSIVYFLGPTDFTRVNITSNVRFMHPVFIALILSTFLIAKKIDRERELIVISILSSIAVMSQFTYFPKMIMIWLILVFFILQLPKKILQFKLR